MIPYFIDQPDPNYYLTDKYFTVDLETTNIGYGSALIPENRIILSVLTVDDKTYVYEHSGDLKDHVEGLVLSNYLLVAQNAKFELQWMKRLGIPLEKFLVYDTLLAEYVLTGNKRVALDLGSIAKRRGFGTKDPFIDICMKGGVCPSQMPISLLRKRCVKDVQQTEQIFLQQRQELKKTDKLKTLYTRCILTPVLADIEFNGLYLDGERVEETFREYTTRFQELAETLSAYTGGINLGSTKQLSEFLYGTLGFSELTDGRNNPIRTPGGSRKTDTATITRLKARNRRQREFTGLYSEYNKLSAAISKNLDFFHGAVIEKGALFYGQFNQAVTQTHRLSSSGRPILYTLYPKPKSVQFQNLPRHFKKLFKARHEGWSVGEIDGAQLEFRVAAHLGHDEVATDAIRNGFDVHSFTASVLTDNGEPTERQGAKAHTFKPLYGGQSGTPAQQAYYKAFRERYGGISSTQQAWINTVLSKKSLVIPSGLEFYWPDTKMSRSGYISNTPSICNYPVQSYATADIIPIAVTKLWHEMKAREMESFIINTIHDSAILEVHPSEKEVLKEISFAAFTDYVYFYLDTVYDDKFSVPLGAELKYGSHWSEGEAFEYSMEPPVLH